MDAWLLPVAGIAGGVALLWVALVAVLWVARPAEVTAREVLRLLPDVLRLLRRLAGDRTLPRGVRVRVWLVIAYLAMPIDLVPDVLPVVGYADDVIVVAALLVLYAAAVLALALAGRRSDARALGGFVPDCVVLFKRLLGDPAVPRARKVLIAVMIGYLAMPIDLVPDFIPVAGQLDDAIVVGLALRYLARGSDRESLMRHWPGPESSRRLVERAAFGSARPTG